MAVKKKQKASGQYIALSILGWVLCLIFGIMLVCNLTIIVKGTLQPERPPSVLGYTPMVTLSGSMEGDKEDSFSAGDLVIVKDVAPESLEVGDVISFMEGTIVVSHRIIEVQTAEDGSIQWRTQGDANNAADTLPVPQDNLIGKYVTHLPKVGDLALFMQKPMGMFIFVGIPLLSFIIYDIIRRQREAAREQKKAAAMEAELQRLRAQAERASRDE